MVTYITGTNWLGGGKYLDRFLTGNINVARLMMYTGYREWAQLLATDANMVHATNAKDLDCTPNIINYFYKLQLKLVM